MPRFGDTPPDHSQGSLCRTCLQGLHRTGASSTDEETFCTVGMGQPARVRTIVLRCTQYENRSDSRLYQLEKIAWELRVGSSGQVIGFRKPEPDSNA